MEVLQIKCLLTTKPNISRTDNNGIIFIVIVDTSLYHIEWKQFFNLSLMEAVAAVTVWHRNQLSCVCYVEYTVFKRNYCTACSIKVTWKKFSSVAEKSRQVDDCRSTCQVRVQPFQEKIWQRWLASLPANAYWPNDEMLQQLEHERGDAYQFIHDRL